ncbi:cytochrome P450 [Kribbella sp. NPDC051620]|uniref:cytochrome P450 n=1 Tax=Kribbella sp. NPDC051620 TaxID=3364120 RepID=UPI00379C089D
MPTRLGNWVTTSHSLCDLVLRDRRFGVRPAGAPVGETPTDEVDLSFLDMNPPDHTRLRRLAQPAFSPKQMAGYRPQIEATVNELLDRAVETGGFDLVGALAAPLPIAVITNLLGIPEADAENFARYGTVIGGALDGVQSLSHAARLQKADAELNALFTGLFALRRRDPADDIISRLVAAEGEQIQPAEMLPMCILLLVAGFETTVNLIGNAVNALLDHPDQWEALCADPATMAPKAVEETLRYDPPVQRTGRFALQPLELAGKPVQQGQFVVTLIGAANRDPEAFPDPDRFDIAREHTADHLAFSSGIHYCVGQPLAQLEATVALQTLAERALTLRRAGRTRRRNSNTIRGPIHLPVRITTSVRRASATIR